MKSWVAPGQPFLAYPSASNHRWLREAGFEAEGDPASIPEQRRSRLPMRLACSARPNAAPSDCCAARDEAGIEDVFLFPAHDLAGGYTMPEAELLAFERAQRGHGSKDRRWRQSRSRGSH